MISIPSDIWLGEIAKHLGVARIFLRPVCREFAQEIKLFKPLTCFALAHWQWNREQSYPAGLFAWLSRKVASGSKNINNVRWEVMNVLLSYGDSRGILEIVKSGLITSGEAIHHIVSRGINNGEWCQKILIDSLLREFVRNSVCDESDTSTIWLVRAVRCINRGLEITPFPGGNTREKMIVLFNRKIPHVDYYQLGYLLDIYIVQFIDAYYWFSDSDYESLQNGAADATQVALDNNRPPYELAIFWCHLQDFSRRELHSLIPRAEKIIQDLTNTTMGNR